MTERKPDLEEELRRALRPQDPGADFTAAVMHAVTRAPRPQNNGPFSAATRAIRSPSLRMSAALAASFIAAVGVVRWDRYVHEGFVAREQALEALRVASQNLNVVHRVVQESEEI
jgi:hypothetical protein